jgi:putative ABC transport system permease protein
MTISDIIHETSSALRANKVRSGLTMLGIIIGISSVIAMISIGQGAQQSVQSSIQSIGSNLIIVMPGAQRSPGSIVSVGRGTAESLTIEDATAIQNQVTGAVAVDPEVSGNKQVTYKGTNTRTSVLGVSTSYPSVRNLTVDTGSFFTNGQVSSLARVAVIGPTVLTDLFGTGADAGSAIGAKISIQGNTFTIIGVSATKGGSGFSNQDDQIFIPVSTAQQLFTGSKYVSAISVEADSTDNMTNVQNQITALLLDRHHISNSANADFSTVNQADIAATAGSVTQIFTVLLAAVAGISLVVGGIGIMNMMLTTVTERTREIGLRKAIGARKKDISRQFLIEAISLTFIGGVIGVILGILISYGVSTFANIQTSVTSGSIILAFCVSGGIGIIFGYYPARRAASLNPIEALRYE